MGRPLGILQRIFSFSKGSKRSKDLFDGDLVNEHGHNVDADDDDLRRTATVRTTGGIGGLGMGITNTESEIVTKPLGSSSSKSGGRGMKKRRLRRASLSASNLLSWGQDRGISSQVPPSIHRDDKDVTWQENVAQDSREPHEQHGGSSSSGVAQMEEPPFLDTKIGARKKQLEAEERFTRILRSSSTKYKVISEQHLDEITPIEHPIQAISSGANESEPLPQERGHASLPRARAQSLGFHSFLPIPKPTSVPAVPSTISLASQYRVTVHRRRVHSRTSFPDANRALDHLNMTESEISCRDSPGAALKVPDISISASAIHFNSFEATNSRESEEKPVKIAISTPDVADTEYSNRLQQLTATTTQITRLSTPESNERVTLPSPASGTKVQTLPTNHQEHHPSCNSSNLSIDSCPSIHTAIAEEPQPKDLKVLQEKVEPGFASCSRYSISLEDDHSIGRTCSPTKSQASKSRNVLKKNWRGRRTSDSNDAVLVQNEHQNYPEHFVTAAAKNPRTKRKGSIHNILSIITTVEGVIDKVQTSAIGGFRQISRPISKDDKRPSKSLIPNAEDDRHIASLIKHWSHDRGTLGTVDMSCDEQHLDRLRSDPSVVSLLDVYQPDGTLKQGTFSNTPVKYLRRNASNRQPKTLTTVSPLARGKSLSRDQPLQGSEDVQMESRAMRMRRTYDQALHEPICPSLRSSQDTQKRASSLMSLPKTEELITTGPSTLPNHVSNFSPDSRHNPATNTRSSNTHSRFFGTFQPGITQHLEDSYTLSNSTLSSKANISALADASMVVEPGSKGDARMVDEDLLVGEDSESMVHSDHIHSVNEQGGGDGKYETIHKSPNRRASEVFSFLNGRRGTENCGGTTAVSSGKTIQDTSVVVHSSFLPMAALMSQSVQRVDEVSTDISGGPLGNAALESDSFASQNSTDRVLLRGIYSFLRGIQSEDTGLQAGPTTPTNDKIPINVTSELDDNGKDEDPFMASSINVNKALPSTPSTEQPQPNAILTSFNLSHASDKPLFVPLSSLPALSPLGSTFPDRHAKVADSPAASPSKRLGDPNENNLDLEFKSNKLPLSNHGRPGRQGSTHRTSTVTHANSNGIKTLNSGSTPQERGLGDGRNFNIASSAQTGRMFGPRSPRPPSTKTPSGYRKQTVQNKAEITENKKALARNSSVKQALRSPTPNRRKQVTFFEGYPFSEELFPAILTPKGPDIDRPTNNLQTPQRRLSHLEASPASSSKLGVYGREIMALARSKSGR
ncbi:hypothetical protein FRC15_003084 [Serendipita sp. 397]|nr:hypothetical protein FRC15_003084 [Serendipita sp. 397]